MGDETPRYHRMPSAPTRGGGDGVRRWPVRPLRLVPAGHALAAPCRHVILTDATTLGAQRALTASVTAGGAASARASRTSRDFKPGVPGQGLLAELTGQVPSRLLHNGSPNHPAGLSSRSQSLCSSQLINVPDAGARGQCLERLGPRPGGQATYCCCCCSAMSTLGDPMGCNTPGYPVLHPCSELAQTHPSSHLILCRLLVLLPPAFPSTRVFSSELALHIRRPK